MTSLWHALRDMIDIVTARIIDQISVRMMLVQIRWQIRAHEHQPEIAEVFRNAERALIERAWGRQARKEPKE